MAEREPLREFIRDQQAFHQMLAEALQIESETGLDGYSKRALREYAQHARQRDEESALLARSADSLDGIVGRALKGEGSSVQRDGFHRVLAERAGWAPN